MAKEAMAYVKVLTPDPSVIDREKLKKPFILYRMTNQGVRFLGVHSIPNILDVMGMPSGGGSPGFSILEPKLRRTDCLLPEYRLIAGYIPGTEMVMESEAASLGNHIGTATAAGIILNYFEVLLPLEVADAIQTEDALKAHIEKSGYVPVPLVEYTTPEIILSGKLAVPAVVPDGVSGPIAGGGHEPTGGTP